MRDNAITRLATRRLVDRPDLPQDQRDFYALNEGVGFDADSDYPIRICRLEHGHGARRRDGIFEQIGTARW